MSEQILSELIPEVKSLTRKEYLELAREVKHCISNKLLIWDSQIFEISNFSNKNNFNSVDLILSEENIRKNSNWRESLSTSFVSSKPFIVKGNTTNFEYKNFQINIIIIPHSKINFGYSYLGYDTFGSVLGRIAKAMGFKMDLEGLWVEYKENNKKIQSFLITNNWIETLQILGFDSHKCYLYGSTFITHEQVFTFLCSSTYFNKDIFLLKNRNHREKTKGGKRETYLKFLEYIENPEIKNNFNFNEQTGTPPWIINLKKSYPVLIKKYNSYVEEHTLKKLIEKKLNPRMVSELLNITEPTLTTFLNFYKDSFEERVAYEKFVLSSTKENLEESLRKYKNSVM